MASGAEPRPRLNPMSKIAYVTNVFWLPLLLLGGCHSNLPYMDWQYSPELSYDVREHGRRSQPNPVVVIPGIASSNLRNSITDEEYWFGPWYKVFFSDYSELELAINPQTLEPMPSHLKASGLPRKALWFDFYGSLFDALEDYANYEPAQPGTPLEGSGRRYYKFAYDWRYDNVDTARKLDAFIDQIREDYRDPELKVDLVAHSMGGLVARYYMRYGTADVLDDNAFSVTQAGAAKVDRLIQLGSPNLGSVSALHQLMNGYQVMLGRLEPESVATMPSTYQLLPHPLVDWLVTAEGKPLKRDIFDARIWRRFQWGIFDPRARDRIRARYETPEKAEQALKTLEAYFSKNLERARRFVWSLTVEVKEPRYRVIAFGGNCKATPARLVVEEVKGVSEVRLWPDQVEKRNPDVNYQRLMLQPGDGRVTKPSLLARDNLDPTVPRHRYSHFPLDYAFFLCQPHGRLTGHPSFQDNLLNALLSPVPGRH